MPKDNRVIKEAVRATGRYSEDEKRRTLQEPQTFGPGEEDELAVRLTPEQGKYLQEQGVLEGDWKFGEEARAEQEAIANLSVSSAKGKGDSNEKAPKLNATIIKLLQENFKTPEEIEAADDEALLAIDGIGPGALKLIRDVHPHKPAAAQTGNGE